MDGEALLLSWAHVGKYAYFFAFYSKYSQQSYDLILVRERGINRLRKSSISEPLSLRKYILQITLRQLPTPIA